MIQFDSYHKEFKKRQIEEEENISVSGAQTHESTTSSGQK